jgi:hypothetical protein
MITRKLLNKFASDTALVGASDAVSLMISEWRFKTTPDMTGKPPSAYTDKAGMADDLSFAELAQVVAGVLRAYPEYSYTQWPSNKIEAGLLALREFDRTIHTSEMDVSGFCDLCRITVAAMVKLNEEGGVWMPVAVPWMREILETNLDLLDVPSFAQFVEQGNAFDKRYLTNDEYPDKRVFAPNLGLPLTFYKTATVNQGLRAVINHCFDMKPHDSISLQDALANTPAVLRMAGMMNDLHFHGVKMPAYQKSLALTGQLIHIFSSSLRHSLADSDSKKVSDAIRALVDMTMTPVKKVGKIKENRFRPGHTSKTVVYWSPAESARGYAKMLLQSCEAIEDLDLDPETQKSIERFRFQVGQDAYQALENVLPYLNKPDGSAGAVAYFTLATCISPDEKRAELERSYLSKLEKAELAALIASLPSKVARVRLMKLNPEVKGTVLMSDLGL